MQDVKMTDARHESAGHEIAEHEMVIYLVVLLCYVSDRMFNSALYDLLIRAFFAFLCIQLKP